LAPKKEGVLSRSKRHNSRKGKSRQGGGNPEQNQEKKGGFYQPMQDQPGKGVEDPTRNCRRKDSAKGSQKVGCPKKRGSDGMRGSRSLFRRGFARKKSTPAGWNWKSNGTAERNGGGGGKNPRL